MGATRPILMSMDERLLNQQTSAEPVVKDVTLPRPSHRKVYTLEGTQTYAYSSSSSIETDVDFNFTLGSLGNAASLEAIFDQYRIIGVKAQFNPQTPSSSALTQIYTAIDYDDIAATSISTLLQYDTLKVAPSNVYFERNLQPRFAVAAYSGSFSSYANMSNMTWIDCASPNVQYYGLKTGVPANSGTASWNVLFTYIIQFRKVR
jgi:hypothetical protein